jgi:hypothetical protein
VIARELELLATRDGRLGAFDNAEIASVAEHIGTLVEARAIYNGEARAGRVPGTTSARRGNNA